MNKFLLHCTNCTQELYYYYIFLEIWFIYFSSKLSSKLHNTTFNNKNYIDNFFFCFENQNKNLTRTHLIKSKIHVHGTRISLSLKIILFKSTMMNDDAFKIMNHAQCWLWNYKFYIYIYLHRSIDIHWTTWRMNRISFMFVVAYQIFLSFKI